VKKNNYDISKARKRPSFQVWGQ